MKAYARQGDADSAIFLFQQFQEDGGEPDDRLVNVTVTACIRARQFKRALQVSQLPRNFPLPFRHLFGSACRPNMS